MKGEGTSAGYVKLSANQDIPDNPYEFYCYGTRVWHQESESKGFKRCAEIMWNDNFRRIEGVKMSGQFKDIERALDLSLIVPAIEKEDAALFELMKAMRETGEARPRQEGQKGLGIVIPANIVPRE